ncbi:hypothetical protein [Syntrophorhabdus aromaticivorans]|uniref:hypothetical protein n=1 Tax=Syntrophorhabdus aromaticivorans TaxID=328301 RepID=UPI0003F8F272|nr:hypothetical protein [Syntrophorhabdus aromaticivorans]
MSKYAKLGEQIEEITKKIEEATSQQKEAHQRIAAAPEQLDRLWEEVKSALVEGNEKNIAAAEKTLADAKRTEQRDIGLSEALRIKLTVLEEERDKLVAQQAEIIARVADTWFVKEIERYEQAREQFLRVAHRLSACSTLLHASERGRAVAAGHLGEVWPYFRNMKIPSIKNFTAARYIDGRPNPDLISTEQERAEVKNELTQ